MRFIKRQYFVVIPIATLFVIIGILYSPHGWTGTPLPYDGAGYHGIAVDHTSQHHHEQDPNCASFARDRLADVQIVLRIGSTQPFDQISSHISNITNCVSNLIIISDREEEIGNGLWSHDIIADLPKVYWEGIGQSSDNEDDQTSGLKAYSRLHGSDSSWKAKTHVGNQLTHRDGWLLDRFKFLPMVEHAYHENLHAKWFFFVEADTYIVWDTFFRLIDRYDAEQKWYMGSPAPGRALENGNKTYFAYGGDGFILSRPAIQTLVHRESVIDESGNAKYTEPSLTEKWADLVKQDCCGDSVLGYTLAKKGIFLSGLYPLFNPHPLHGIPFGPSGKPYWCQPVLSLHKTWPGDVPRLSQFLIDRPNERPLIYADLFDYLELSHVGERIDWQNSDWNGFEEPPESPVHRSKDACAGGCHSHNECFQWTYWAESSFWEWMSPSKTKCTFVRSIRLGSRKDHERTWITRSVWTSGWDLEKITNWASEKTCAEPEWVEPSLERIF